VTATQHDADVAHRINAVIRQTRKHADEMRELGYDNLAGEALDVADRLEADAKKHGVNVDGVKCECGKASCVTNEAARCVECANNYGEE
jgi:hypothetical protein